MFGLYLSLYSQVICRRFAHPSLDFDVFRLDSNIQSFLGVLLASSQLFCITHLNSVNVLGIDSIIAFLVSQMEQESPQYIQTLGKARKWSCQSPLGSSGRRSGSPWWPNFSMGRSHGQAHGQQCVTASGRATSGRTPASAVLPFF